jgi:hypothetical protein
MGNTWYCKELIISQIKFNVKWFPNHLPHHLFETHQTFIVQYISNRICFSIQSNPTHDGGRVNKITKVVGKKY